LCPWRASGSTMLITRSGGDAQGDHEPAIPGFVDVLADHPG
jgi:hypothetical protein